MDKEIYLSQGVIGAAIEVHRELGAGLLESVYEKALCAELYRRGFNCEQQKVMPVLYKGERIGEHRIDLLVNNRLVIEVKSVERFESVFDAQILSYMKLGQYPVGLLLNFNTKLLKNGIKRFVL
ncbi:MAG: GxxExxY protein [Pseudomonadota bacterium]